MEEGLYLGDREKQWVLVDILPGNEVHHADGLACQLELHSAHHVALLDGGRGIIGQVEIFLRHRAIPRGGQQGHHAVGGVELQGVGIGGVFDRDLRQRLVGVQRGLDGKALEHPVDELGGLVQSRAAVGIAVIIAGVGALHDAEDVGCPVLVGPRDIALIAAVVLVGHHVAHAALHGAAVEPAAAGLVQGHVLAQQHKALGVLFLGRHREGGGGGDLLEGIKAHQVAQDQVHVHGGGGVAAVQPAGICPGAVGGADALGEGVHLAHPARQVAARELVGQTHGGLIGVARHHGVKGFPVGKGLARAHVGVVGVVDIVRDGKGHRECVVQLVGIVGQHQRNGHIFRQAPGGHLLLAVFFIDDDVGVGVHDIGALGFDIVDRAGVEHGSGRHGKAAEQDGKG